MSSINSPSTLAQPPVLRFEGRSLELRPEETVLGCFERYGIPLPSSCRSGLCQICMLKASGGQIPERAQQGLKPSWQRQGYLLACVCRPVGPLSLARSEAAATYSSRIVAVQPLAPGVVRVLLEKPAEFEACGGQFIQLMRPHDGLTRPYSLACTARSQHWELHVAVAPEGRLSPWLASGQAEAVSLRGPFGECFYDAPLQGRPLLLAGTGTGLAPLLGVVRTALEQDHGAPIHLYHGAAKPEQLYLWHELQTLAKQHPELHVTGCVLGGLGDGAPTNGCLRQQPLEQALFADLPDVRGFETFVCGSPVVVQRLKKKLYLAGVPLAQIHSDPFVVAPPVNLP